MTPALTDYTAGEHVVAASYLPSALQQLDSMPEGVVSFIENCQRGTHACA